MTPKGPMELKPIAIRGEDSEGMLCGRGELGLMPPGAAFPQVVVELTGDEDPGTPFDVSMLAGEGGGDGGGDAGQSGKKGSGGGGGGAAKAGGGKGKKGKKGKGGDWEDDDEVDAALEAKAAADAKAAAEAEAEKEAEEAAAAAAEEEGARRRALRNGSCRCSPRAVRPRTRRSLPRRPRGSMNRALRV